MLINLSLLCRTLALFTLYRLASADQNENENQNVAYLPRDSLDTHYPVRFDKPALNAALEDNSSSNVYSLDGSSSSNDSGLSEFSAHEESGSDENASLQTEFSGSADEHNPAGQLSSTDSSPAHTVNEHPDAQGDSQSDDQGVPQSEQLGDLVPNHSNTQEQSHRLTRRKHAKSEQPNEKQVIEFNSLDDQPTYSEVSDDKNDDDDNGLIKYKAKHNFEYSTNLLDDHFFKNAKMLVAGDSEFSYDDQEAWTGTCNDANAKQSPIAITMVNSITDTRIKLDIGIRYAKDIPVVELENNGHTVQFLIPKSAGDLIVTGPAVDFEIYKATALHFHWGENDTVGSEHVIMGQRYPLEMHIVHYNTKYSNLEEALKQEDGTLVIGVVFKAGKRRNDAIEPLIRKLEQVRCRGQKTDLREINLLRLLPSKVRRLYQYYGSLTTPPCTATVNWVVIETPNLISSEQLAKFRLLTEDPLCQTPLTRNWRNLQDLKNRDVRRSPKI